MTKQPKKEQDDELTRFPHGKALERLRQFEQARGFEETNIQEEPKEKSEKEPEQNSNKA